MEEDQINNEQAQTKKESPFLHLFSGSFIMVCSYIVTFLFGSQSESGEQWKISLSYTAILVALLIPLFKKLKNIILFTTLLWLLLAVFPLIHYLHFENNPDNYFYDQTYLKRNVAKLQSKI